MFIGLGLYLTAIGRALDAYAIAGFSPKLVFAPKADVYRTGGSASTFADLVTFTRAGNATYTDATGTIQTASANVARRNHHVYEGGEWVNAGMLVEPTAATNLLLNSATLSTQNVTVTAQAYTLHFTGTGTVTLSGASTAGPLVGTGTGENNRVSLTFTPSAGTLTLTVSGTVTNAQLEAGSVPSSYIPTAGSTATRAAETVSIAAAKLPFINPDNLGPELVTNGDFSDGSTGWQHNNSSGTSTFTVSSGLATFTRGAFGDSFRQEDVAPATAGVFQLTFDIAAISGGNLRYSFSTNSAANPANQKEVSAVGSYSTVFYSDGTLLDFVFDLNANGASITIDNISVREVTALELSIAMRGRMTYADTSTGLQVIFLNWETPDQIRYRLSTTGTRTGQVIIDQTASAVTDSVSSVETTYSPGINVPFSIASRHGSTFINGAVDGVALTADLTPTSLPNLSATPLSLAFSGGPMIIEQFAMWDVDLGDSGISEASS